MKCLPDFCYTGQYPLPNVTFLVVVFKGFPKIRVMETAQICIPLTAEFKHTSSEQVRHVKRLLH